MEEDAEILDWGHEDEAGVASNSEQRSFVAEDAEDAVSLGGDEEDEFLSSRSRAPQDTTHRGQTPMRSVQQTVKNDRSNVEADAQRSRRSQPSERAESGTPSKEQGKSTSVPEQSPMLGRTHSFGKLTHALPPKPVVSNVPFVHPSHPSIIEATAMASRSDRDKRNGGGSKTNAIESGDPLPPGWEIRHPRSGHGIYYYNVRTEESTWIRPTSTLTREKRDQRSDARDDLVDRGLRGRSDETLISRVGRPDGDGLSYDDRHYRPGENGRRDDRTGHTYIMTGDSYVPDSDSRQNGRSSPSPSRHRDSVRAPSSRRPVSPHGSYSDSREAPPASTLSVEDRFWVARDVVIEQRSSNHRHHDTDPTPTPANYERRNPPRDSDRSSALRPRSPPYARDFQEATHPSNKSAQPISQTQSSRQQSHLARDLRNSGTYRSSMHQARADETSSTRPSRSQWADENETRRSPIPRTGSISAMEGDTKSLASDAQRPSRRRTPLPPQSAIFREGSRQTAPSARDNGFSAPVSGAAPLDHERQPRGTDRPTSDMPRTLARRSLSPPSLRDTDSIDHAPRSRGRARPSSTIDSYVPRDSFGSRNGDRMHIDGTPPRISDPPRQSAQRYEEHGAHVPRHPRAMMEASGGPASRGPSKAERSPGPDRTAPRPSVASSVSARDRSLTDRPTPVEPSFTKRESARLSTEARGLSSAPNIKLSGTNNTPIGNRTKFSGSAAPPPSSASHRGGTISGSNVGPVGSRPSRFAKEYEHSSRPDTMDAPSSVPDVGIRDDMPRRSPTLARRPVPPPEVELLPRPPRQGTSRFGPPLVKEAESRRNLSPESIRSGAHIAEDGSRATPPPPSRESSMASVRDTVGISSHSGQPSHRPSSPSINRESAHPPIAHYRDDTARHRDRVHSPVNHPRSLPAQTRTASHHDMEVDAPPQRRNSPPPPLTQRRRTMDTYVSERSRDGLQNVRGDHHTSQPAPMVQADARPETRVPLIHPDRARMLQNGLPPRPSTDLGLSRSGRGQRAQKDESASSGPGDRHYEPSTPAGEQRYPEADGGRSQGPPSRGGSLLDRLTMEGDGPNKSSSLRDRVQLPSKRDREEMQSGDLATMDQDFDDHEYDGTKRARRRGAKSRKGRRVP